MKKKKREPQNKGMLKKVNISFMSKLTQKKPLTLYYCNKLPTFI